MAETAVYVARPTVKVDGQESEVLDALLRALETTESEGGLGALEMRLANVASRPDGTADLAFEDARVLKLGARVEVLAGDETDPVEIFRGTVTALEGVFESTAAPELIVLAEDALQAARLARRTAVHEEATVSGLVSTVAGAAGLTPSVSGLSDPVGTQVQLNESDLAFLRRMLARQDGDLQVRGAELAAAPRADTRRGTVELAMYAGVKKARVTADLAQQVTETTAAGWDAKAGQRVTATSTGAHAGPGRGTSGADALREAIGDRSEHVADLAVAADAEAKALADAAFDRRARRFVVVEATAVGDPRVRVGAEVRLSGLGPRFSNTYHVVRAVHRWSVETGYETDFEGECAFLGEG